MTRTYVVDPYRTNELIDAYEQAAAALAKAQADIDAELASLRSRRATVHSDGEKAALTKGIKHLEQRQRRYVR